MKLIRPRNDTQSLCINPDVEIEMSTGSCQQNAKNHVEQSKDDSEKHEENIEAESRLEEFAVPLRRSARERPMLLKYLNCLFMIREDQAGV